MKIKSLAIIAVTGLMVASLTTAAWATPPKMQMTTDTPASIMAPDKLETSIGTMNFFDGVPDEASVEKVYNYLDRARRGSISELYSGHVNVWDPRRSARIRDQCQQQDRYLRQPVGLQGAVADSKHLNHVCNGLAGP